jgi:hypothetical protein
VATRRRGLLPAIACVVIALVVLLVAASRHTPVRTASVDSPNQTTIAELHPSTTVCEGPVTSDGPARTVGIWGAAAGPPSTLTVNVQDAATSRVLASGALQAAPAEAEWTARLARGLPGGRPLRICLTDDSGTFSLAGSGGSLPNVIVTGIPSGQRFSLVLLSDNRSLLGSLSTAFSRASLWRPDWVGSWTFWVLTLALLATFALAVVAVTSAAAVDEEDRPPWRETDNDDLPPIPDGRSEAGQDRPQTVP